jgi:agmatine deiminase
MIQTLKHRMPAEWESHEATWLAWPHNPETWPGKLERIPPIWMEMIKALHTQEKVNVCVNDAEMEWQVAELLTRHGIDENVFLHRIPTNDAWMRDYGPVFIKRSPSPQPSPARGEGENKNTPPLYKGGGWGEVVILDWTFNSWGQKYGPWDLDDIVPKKVAKHFQLPCIEPGIVLEGGSIDVNGQGTLLTTEQCLLNKNRNPHLSKTEIEEYLKNYLGVTHILWLGEGIVGDDTDGHVDDITRFVAPDTVVTVIEEDPADDNYKLLQDNLKRLQKMKDQSGKSLKIMTLPMPGPVFYEDRRLPASYANFYIANGMVLVPTYDHPNDARALGILRELFPTRKIVGINCVDLVWGLGAFHCVTQQQPISTN